MAPRSGGLKMRMIINGFDGSPRSPSTGSFLPSPGGRRLPRRAALIALPLLFTACSVGPDYVTPAAPVPVAHYKESGDWKQDEPKDDMIRGKWWEIYHDPQLNALEDQVNISNQN